MCSGLHLHISPYGEHLGVHVITHFVINYGTENSIVWLNYNIIPYMYTPIFGLSHNLFIAWLAKRMSSSWPATVYKLSEKNLYQTWKHGPHISLPMFIHWRFLLWVIVNVEYCLSKQAIVGIVMMGGGGTGGFELPASCTLYS